MKIKQDINFLEYPLWFPTNISKEDGYVWTDREGYIYRSAYKVPDKTDGLILFYLLLKTQKQDYQEKLVLSQYEILKACGFYGNSWYYERLEDSLRRWIGIIIEFKGSFYDGKNYKTLLFHILDSAKIREEDQKVEICFNPNFLLKIKESTFFKYIHFDYYKALKRPLSRRLFEILCKTFKGRESWEIDLVKLGTKLTLFKRKISTRQGEKEVMYHSDVLIKIKPAIHEINRLAENKELFKSLEIPVSEAFSLEYHLKKENKIIVFNKRIPNWVKAEAQIKAPKAEAQIKAPKAEAQIKAPKAEAQIKAPTEVKEALPLKQLYEMSKSQTSSVKEAIKICCSEKGFEYVRGNILYANEKATKNYGAYLKKCLKEDWGGEFREVERKKEETEKALKEEKIKEKEKLNKTYEKLEELNKAYEALAHEEIARLEPFAIERCVALGMRRNFISRITLMEKIVEIHQEENHSKSNTL